MVSDDVDDLCKYYYKFSLHSILPYLVFIKTGCFANILSRDKN